MNGPFQVAQANIATQTSGKPPARIVKVTKPFGEQSVVVPLSYDGSVKADLSSIAGENITLVHIGEKLIILFDNKSTVTLEPFFDANGAPLNGLTVEVSPGRDLTGAEFAALFPVTEDRSILPAAGDGNGPGAQASGANFTSVTVDPLAAANPLDLLGQEDLPTFTINTLLRQNDFINDTPTAGLITAVALDEDEIPGLFGNPDGQNDINAPHTISGTLAHQFNLDGAGTISFAAMNGVQQVINGITVTFTWNDATHTLTANDGSGDVFKVVITNPATGDYTVTLLEALHHHTDAQADNTETSDVFNLTYTVRDSNNDTATGTLTLEINDDTPTISVTPAERGNDGQQEHPSLLVSLDESIESDRGANGAPDGDHDDTGNTQPGNGDPIGRASTVAGEGESLGGLQSLFHVSKSAGADGEKSITYSYTLSLTGATEGGESQEQNAGVATTLKATGYENGTIYLFQEDATHIVGRVGGEDGPVAIRITLDHPDSLSGGQLVVEQYLPIDHENDPNDENNFDSQELLQLVGGDASLGVTLTATITDGDGDKATASNTVVLANNDTSSIGFQDDGPAPLEISVANGAANGLFFGGFTPNNDQWGVGSGINTTGEAEGWHIGPATLNGAANPQLERVGDGYRGADSPTDSVMVDMEATPGNLKLTQDISGLSEGTHHLTFEIGAASDAAAGSAVLKVYWNGDLVGTYTPHSGVMQTISIDVVAQQGSNQLTFEEVGTSGDNTGTFLANVKLGGLVIIDETKGIDPGSDDVAVSEEISALFDSVHAPAGSDPDMDGPQYAQGKDPVIVLGAADYGTDGPGTIKVELGVSSPNGVDSGLTTTDGKEIYLFAEDGLVVGRYDANGGDNPDTVAFALHIGADGTLSIVQYVSLHHPDTASPDEGIYLKPGTVQAVVTITDGDGDHATSSTDISGTVRFEDDGPSVDAAQNSSLRDWTVDEDVLSHGNDASDHPADLNDYTAINGKPLGVNWGADGAKALTFAVTGDHPMTDANPTIVVTDKNGAPVAGGLTSGGEPLTYEITTNPDGGQTLTAYKGDDHSPSNVIFTLTLDPDAGSSGTFSFELKGPLDHPTGDGQNTLNLNFGFDATDGDGDTTSSGITIRVTDDVPVVTSNGTNYITNGDFQAGNWSTPAWWGSTATTVDGWSISGDPSLPPQNGIQFERQSDGFLGLNSSTHQGMIDMGGSPGNYDLTQQFGVNGTHQLVDGQQYVLELEVGAPFPSTAKMEVWWNGTLIGVIDTNVSSGQMEKFAFIVTGSGNPETDKLVFKEIGEGTAPIQGTVNGEPLQGEGYHGTYIANVKMFALNGVVDEDALNNGNAKGIGDSQPGDGPDGTAVGGNVNVSGALGVKWGSDEADVHDVNGVQDGANSALTGRSLTFTDANVTVLGVNALTSNGDAVSFALIDNNTKLVGFVDNDHSGTFSNGDRLVLDVTLSDDDSGSFKFTLHDNLDHAPGASENDIALQFNFTATDSDGDSAKGTFAVGVDDDLPILVSGTEVSVSVNENDILTPWSIGSSPLDGHTELSSGAAKVTGSLAGLVNFGADKPDHGGFGFADKATVVAYMESLHLFSKQTALPENGKELTYDLVGNVLTAREPGPDGNIVFTLTLNSNGSFEFRLYDELVHVKGEGENTDLRSGDSGSVSGIEFGKIIVATDADGDSVTLGDNFQIKIVDDVPEVSIVRTLLGAVQHDETPGVQFLEDTNDAAIKAVFAGAGGVVNPGHDLDVNGSGAIGYAHSLLPLVNVLVNYGADTPAASQTLSLQLIDGNTGKPAAEGFQRDSGLFTTEHQKIILSKEGDLIVGRVDADGNGHVDQNDVAAFAIHIEQDGGVSIVQYLSLEHPNSSSNDENVDLSGLIAAQVSVTDSDGDAATDYVNIGDKIRFGDDGPEAVNDSQKSVTEGGSAISGNVMSNDDAGSDGATVTKVHVNGQDYDIPQDGSIKTVTSSLGLYTFDDHGNWTFTPNGNLNNANGVDASFTYTLTDGDGDTDTAKQTIKINDGANPTVSSNITIALDEEALGNVNATGTNPSSNAEQDNSHTLTFTSGSDNIQSIGFAAGTNGITVNVNGINGADIVWTRVDATHLIGKIGGIDAISIELTLPGLPILAGGNTGVVTVTATLLDNFPHPNGNDENSITLSGIKVVATDTDNDTVTGNVTVTIKDDVPAATPEESHNVAEGTSMEGQLHFVAGADGATVTHINGQALHFNANDGGYSQAVDIGYGTIKVKADGSYIFTADASVHNTNGDPVAVDATFTVTDRDGDTSTADMAFAITDRNVPTGGNSSATVDDDGLSGGNPNSTIGDIDANAGDTSNDSEAVFTGTLAGTMGGDGAGEFSFVEGTGKVGQENVEFIWSGHTLTVKTVGGDRPGTTLFTVEITDPATGAYKVTLEHNILQTQANNNENGDAGINLLYKITDSDGSQADGHLNIKFNDDAPSASSYTGGHFAEGGVQHDIGDAVSVLHINAGADGLTGVTFSTGDRGGSLTIDGNGHLIYTTPDHVTSSTAVTETFTYTVTDGDGDTVTKQITFGVDDTGIASVSATNTTVDEDDIQTIGNHDSAAGDNATSASGHISYTLGADALKSVELSANTAGLTKLDGTAIHTTWDAGTHTLIGYGGNDTSDVVFKIVITGEGNTGADYEVTLLQPIKHPDHADPSDSDSASYEDNKDLIVTATVTDTDGSQKSTNFTVSIDDDSPVVQSPEAGSTSEANIAAATATAHGSLGIHFGADGPGASGAPASSGAQHTVNFDDALNGTLPGNQYYTHDGFTFHTNQGIANHDGDAGQMYGTVIMVENNGGQPFTITQMDLGLFGTSTGVPADNVRLTGIDAHTGQPIVVIFNVGTTIALGDAATTFHAAGTAFDGVSLSSLKIEPVAGWQGAYIFNGSVVVDNVVFNSGSAPLTHGAVSFTDLDTAVHNVTIEDSNHQGVAPAALTSHGQAIHYALLDSMTLVAYTGDTAPTAIDGANVVFSVVLSQDANHPNGTYDFTLHKPLDDLPSGISDLNFTFAFTAKDGDGDAVNGHFTVDVKDDTPSIAITATGESNIQLTTHDANTIGAASDVTVSAANFGDVFHVTSSYGADGSGSTSSSYKLAITATPVNSHVDSGLDSHGQTIYLYDVNGTIIGSTSDTADGVNDGNKIFALTVDSNGVVTLTQFAEIDHPIGSDPSATGAPFDDHTVALGDGLISLTREGSITDGDGDTSTSSASVDLGGNIRFTDDGPRVTALADTLSVDEGNLPSDRNPTAHSPVGIAQSDFGSLHINWGADNGEAKHLAFAKDEHGNVIGPDLTSDGVKLLYEIQFPGDTPGNEQIVAYKDGDPDHTPVFMVTLYESGNGGYTYVQYQHIDHTGEGTDTSQFNFNIIAYDADGDSVQQTLTIKVKDDAPVAHNDVDSTTSAEQTLTFDDVALGDGTEQHLPTPYHGFNFIHTGVTNPVGSGPHASLYATHSGDNVAFIGEKDGVERPDYEDATAGAPLTIEHTDGSKFTALGAWFSSHGWDPVTITIKAYDANDVLIGTLVANINPDVNGPTYIDMSGLGSVHHITMDSPAGQYFGFDDFSYRDDASVATGNVLTGVDGGLATDANATDGVADTAGADGLHSITWNGASAPNAGVSTIVGTYGTLTVDANGNYFYKLNADNPAVIHWTTGDAALSDVFTYTIEDGDGDTDTATLTINSTGADDGVGLFNLMAAVSGEDATVYESGLPTGSSHDASLLTQTGTFNFTTPDGIVDLVIGTTKVVTNGALTLPGSPISTEYGQITITGVDLTTGVVSYSYTLTHSTTDHGPLNDGSNNVFDNISVKVTDRDGDTATDTLAIKVVDDVPHATAEGVQTVAEGASADGILDFVAGADGATVTHINGVQLTFGQDGYSGPIDIGAGTIKVTADGHYVFTADSSVNDSVPVHATFTVTDSDGDSSTADIDFTVIHTNSLPTAGVTTASVDDDGLAHGNPGDVNNGDITLDSPENVAHGTLPHEYKTDGSADSDPIGFAPMDGKHGTVGTESVTYHWNETTNTLVATSDRGDIFKVVVDEATGKYDLTLLKPVMHESGGGENDATVELTYQVKDSSDDTADGKLTVTFNDDTPVAHDQAASVTEGSSPTLNAILVIDLSQSMNDNSGVQGLTRLELMQQAVANYLNSPGVHFNEIVIYTFNDGAHYEGTFTNVQDAIDEVNSYNSHSLVAATEYDSTAEDVREHFEQHVDLTPADQTHLLFLSDGDPTGGSGLSNSERNDWSDFLNDAGVDKVYAVGFGGIDDTDFLDPMAPRPGDEAIAVEDPDQLAATLEGSLPSEISGNVLLGSDSVAGGVDDVSYGADGGHIQSIKVGNVTYTYHPDTGNITASDGHNPTQHTPDLTVTTPLGGTLEFNFQTGAWEYSAPPNGVSHTTDEKFDYVVIDNDGDTADATLTITVVDVPNKPPVLHLNEQGAGGNYRDEFEAKSYDNSDGSKEWTAHWSESGDNNNASSGSIRINSDALRLGDNDNDEDGNAYIERAIDLSGTTSAILTFTYEKDTSSTSNEGLTVQAWNGTAWRDLTTAAVSGNDANGSTGTRTAELTSQDTKIRFVMNDELDQGEYYYIDNVNIAYTTVASAVDHVANFTEHDAAISIAAAGPTITDTDDTIMESAKIVLTNAKAGDVLGIGSLPTGIDGHIDTSVAGQITVTLSGNASLADYQAAIKAVTYQNTSNNPGSDDRVIHVTVTDDHGNASNVATTTIHVTPTNDAPTTNDVTVSANEGASPVAIHLTGGDVDGAVSSFKISGLPSGVTLYSDALFQHAIGNGDTVSASGNSATVYLKPASEDANGKVTFQYAAIDDGNATDATPATATVNIASVNDAPSGADKTFDLSVGGSKTFSAADFGFSDAHDDPNANALKSVIITSLPDEGTLKLNGFTVTVGQEILLAQIGNLKFTAIGSEVGDNYASFTFQVKDNGGTANGGVDTDQTPNTITFDIPTSPVIWAPEAFNFAPASTSKADMFTSLNMLKFADASSTGAMTVTLKTDDKDARFLATGTTDVTVSGNDTTSMTLTGTLAAINAFIADNHLTYDLNNDSSDKITVTITDNHGASDTATITVNDNYIGGGTGQNLPLADTFNIHQTLIDLGSGTDNITTGWNHLATDPTTYRGGSGSDTIRVVFTGDQLNEILNDATERDNLRSFLGNPSGHDLDLSNSSWHAKADQFETANLGLAAPDPTGGDNNYLDLATWKTLPAAVGSGTAGADLMVGTAAGQTLEGLGGNDVLAAYHGGSNTLNGGAGSDLLLGGDGNDILNGGQGNDILSGGKGADTFKAELGAQGTAHQDTIVDYNFSEGDKLDLSALLDAAFDPGDNINSFVKVSVSGDDLLVRVNTSGNGNFTDAQNTFLLAGAHTSGGGDPIKIYFDGHDHVVTG